MVPKLTDDCVQAEGGLSRIAFIHNPSTAHNEHVHGSLRISSFLGYLSTKGLLRQLSASQLLTVLAHGPVISQGTVDQVVMSADGPLLELFSGALIADVADDRETVEHFMKASQFLVKKLKLAPGEQALVVNGRVSAMCCGMSGGAHGISCRLLDRSDLGSSSLKTSTSSFRTSTGSACCRLWKR